MISRRNLLARTLINICIIWIVLFLLIGGTTKGKKYYSSFMKNKAGLGIVGIGIPTLLIGTFGIILSIRPSSSSSNDNNNRLSIIRSIIWENNNYYKNISGICRIPFELVQSIVSVICSPSYKGDPDFHRIGLSCLFVPLLCFATTSIIRKCSEQTSMDDFIKEFGNCCGLAALLGLGLLLIPISRHSIINEAMGWNAASVTQLHIWIGRFIICSVVVHACSHISRWIYIQHHAFRNIVFPPPSICWQHINDGKYQDIEQTLYHNDNTTISCTDAFRYWTGFIAFSFLMVIAIITLHPIRRNWYRIFYSIHVISGPIVLLFVIIHWNRSIMYIAGGLLYYAASSFPVITENWFSKYYTTHRGPVEIISVETIREEDPFSQRCAVSVTFATTLQGITRHRPGQYVKVYIPTISKIGHPFTVNTTLLESGENLGPKLRIIFRSTGHFTKLLTNALSNTNIPRLWPNIYIDGFHGPSQRLEQVFQHDVVVLVAGGIGITPYLSLIHAILQEHHNSIISSTATSDGIRNKSNGRDVGLRSVTLHWVCRDNALIEYMKREYLERFIATQKHQQRQKQKQIDNDSRLRFQIVINRTGHQQNRIKPSSYSDVESNSTNSHEIIVSEQNGSNVDKVDENRSNESPYTTRSPFRPSKFETGSKYSYYANFPALVSFCLIAWLGFLVLWYMYVNLQENSNQILARLYSPIFIIVYGLLVSVVINILFEFRNDDRDGQSEWALIKTHTEEENRNQGEFNEEAAFTIEDVDLPEQNHDLMVKSDLAKEDSRFSSDALSSSLPNSTAEIEEREGRPTVHQFINYFDQAANPGLFTCGPSTLMKDIRVAVAERSLARWKQCASFSQQQHHFELDITLYEETFEL